MATDDHEPDAASLFKSEEPDAPLFDIAAHPGSIVNMRPAGLTVENLAEAQRRIVGRVVDWRSLRRRPRGQIMDSLRRAAVKFGIPHLARQAVAMQFNDADFGTPIRDLFISGNIIV